MDFEKLCAERYSLRKYADRPVEAEKLEKVLERMAGCPVEVHGSGRTDAGVHAVGQVANFHLPDGWKPDAAVKNGTVSEWIQAYLNQYLPEDKIGRAHV